MAVVTGELETETLSAVALSPQLKQLPAINNNNTSHPLQIRHYTKQSFTSSNPIRFDKGSFCASINGSNIGSAKNVAVKTVTYFFLIHFGDFTCNTTEEA